jgi:hypothetical protein
METQTRDWTLQPTAGHETHGQSVICDGDGRSIAIVYDGDRDGRLIAAAPDLLEACKSALNGFRTMYEAMEEGRDASEIYADESFWPLGELRAAIAKATKQD